MLIHDLINIIGSFLLKIMNSITSINLWSFIISFLLLIFLGVMIPNAVLYVQAKRITKRFLSGRSDQQTIRQCEKLKKRFSTHQNTAPYDMLCIMLSAMYMENENIALFFENVNAIKNVTDHLSQRIYILLVAYFVGESYLKIKDEFSKHAETESSIEQFVHQFIKSHNKDGVTAKVLVAEEKITKPEIVGLLRKISDIEDGLRF